MKKVSNVETKKLENLYKLNKLTELEKEAKKLLEIESNNNYKDVVNSCLDGENGN